MTERVLNSLTSIREKTSFVPKVAITLGSGLGNFAKNIRVEAEIPYKEIPGFPVSTAPGHDGRYILGYVENVPVVCMKGRIHYYEGYSMEEVVMPLRVMAGMGADTLVLTNASGGINERFSVGSLVCIIDQIASFVPNPLIGKNDPEEGPRFHDMSEVYDMELRGLLKKAAEEESLLLDEGVYCQLTGPSFETPAEIRMLKTIGADMVGMSTAVEANVARHIGMRVAGVSLISNLASGISKFKLSEEDVILAGKEAEPKFERLIKTFIKKIGEEA